MTTQTQTEIQRFQEFVAQKVDNGHTDLSPEQALAMWQERKESVKAIREALDDFEAGDIGEPADDVIAQLRERIRTAQ